MQADDNEPRVWCAAAWREVWTEPPFRRVAKRQPLAHLAQRDTVPKLLKAGVCGLDAGMRAEEAVQPRKEGLLLLLLLWWRCLCGSGG